MDRLIRVFPNRTSYTPDDTSVFIGTPPLIRPMNIDEVHISITFTWDIAIGEYLALAWKQYYPIVKLGGPAFNSPCNTFTSGQYIKHGVIFTSRGCNYNCPWCLVPKREGKISLLPIVEGHTIQDNNFLQTSLYHQEQVFRMLRSQKIAASFTGGIASHLVNDTFIEEIRKTRIDRLFLACDTDQSLIQLEKALNKLSFLGRNKLFCYVLLGFNGETLDKGVDRCRRVWQLGAIPFAQLYQPAEKLIEYPIEWKHAARSWSRPAIIRSIMKCD